MKFAVFSVISCLFVCFVHATTVTEWGDVSGRVFGYRDVKTPDFKQSFYAFAFPAVIIIYICYLILDYVTKEYNL